MPAAANCCELCIAACDYRGEALDQTVGGGGVTSAKLIEFFAEWLAYSDIPGLCKVATFAEIEVKGWSLNLGRYVGVAPV